MNIEQVKLKNNLDTLFIDSPGSNSSTVQIWFRAGSALESKEDEGVAHFLEHMFFKGTEKRPGAKIAHDVESYGGEINAFTSFDYTCYYINTPSTHITETVDILMDMVSNPEFKESELIPERDVVFEEYRRSQDNPNQFGFQKMQKQVFTKGYGHPILGREDTIKNFSREQIINFRKKHYNLSNALLVVAGDISKKNEIIDIIEQFKMPDGDHSEFCDFKLKNKPSSQIYEKEVRMAQLTMLIQAPDYKEADAPAEDLALSALGFGESSRLYKELVLEGAITNAISASTMFFSHGGVHFLRFSCPVENLPKAYTKLQKVLKRTLSEGLTDSEIAKIKNQYIASKIFEKESIESYAFGLGHGFAQSGNIHCEQEFIEQLKKCSSKQVNQKLKNIFGKNIHLSLQLPKKTKSEKVKKDLEKFHKAISTLGEKKLKSSKGAKIKVKKSKYDPQVKVAEIKPGIKLIHRYNNMTPTFSLHAYLKGGLTEESKKNNGLYNLMASTLAKGYKSMKYEPMRLELEEMSSSLNGFTGKNAYGITMHGLSDNYERSFDHFFGTLLTPQFPAKHITHEKEMVVRLLENQQEDPVKQLFRQVNEVFFHGHSYAYNVVGSNDSIKKIKRADIVDTHAKNLRNKEMIITYAGDMDFDEVFELVSEKIKDLKARKKKETKAKKFKKIKDFKDFIHFDRVQSNIFIGFEGSAINQKRDLFLKMLSTHLSGQSSDLFVKVRDEMGLCYAVQPIHFSALEGGFWGIYIGAGHDKTEAAIGAIREILYKIKDHGLSVDDVERIKKTVEGQSQISIQTNEDYANIYTVPELHSIGLDYHYQNTQKIKKITAKEFNEFCKKFLGQKETVIVVGPTEDYKNA